MSSLRCPACPLTAFGEEPPAAAKPSQLSYALIGAGAGGIIGILVAKLIHEPSSSFRNYSILFGTGVGLFLSVNR